MLLPAVILGNNRIQGAGEMAITDNWGYVKQVIVGFLGLLMAQCASSAESKFLPLLT